MQQANNKLTRHAVARLWAMFSTLNSDVVKNLRPARAGVYDEDYPLPLDVSSGAIRPVYTLNFNVHDWTDPAADDYSRFEAIYYPEARIPAGYIFAERAVLQGEAAGVTFQFQYVFSDGRWDEHLPLSARTEPSERWRPVDPARVCRVIHDFANAMEHDLGHACFDAEILGAVGALPLPIAEQVAWYLAPPSLEDNLLRRGMIDA